MSLRTRITTGVATASVAGLAFIAGHEGTVHKAYPDPAHGWAVPTICTGHTGPDVYRGQVATPAMCRAWLSQDAQKAAEAVKRCTPGYPLTQHEMDALVSFTFNVGTTAYCNSTLAKKLTQLDREGAIQQFDRWTYAGGKDCKIRSNNCYGLYVRRMAEKQLFAKGNYE